MSHSKEWRDQRYVKIGELADKFGVSKSTIYKWVNERSFPKPIVFGEAKKNTTVRWLETDIQEWLDIQPRDKDE